MFESVDWKHRASYMAERHGVTTEQADEALNDVDAVIYNPDPKSDSGVSVRVIGYSATASALLTVIVVPNEDGGWWGVNGWKSNSTERRVYREYQEEGDE